MLYMVTFTINIPPMLAYIPYMDPMGYMNGWGASSDALPQNGTSRMKGFDVIPGISGNHGSSISDPGNSTDS